MASVYPIAQARSIFGALVRRAAHRGERITITDRGEPAVVMISVSELEDLEDDRAIAVYEARKAVGDVSGRMTQEQVRAMVERELE